MATKFAERYQTHRGPASLLARYMHDDDYRLPLNDISAAMEKDMFPRIGGGWVQAWSLTNTPGFTLVTGGTNDAIAESTSGGVILTAASDDNFDMTLTSKLAYTPTAGEVFSMLARIQVSAVTGIGFKIGLTTGGAAAALPFGTNYTDAVVINKEIADATVTGKVRGTSGTEATSGDLGDMVNDTEIEIGIVCKIGAAGANWGFFSYNGTVTAFTADQLTQLAALLTTPQTMYGTIHITGVTATNPTLTVTSLLSGVDR
jgi:hypothetical protein